MNVYSSGSEGKVSACNGDLGSIPGSGRSPREGNGNPLQYSCLENSMDGEAWWATVLWGRKESDMTEQLHFTPSHVHKGISLNQKGNETGSFAMTWMNLESVIQSEVRKRKTNTLY